MSFVKIYVTAGLLIALDCTGVTNKVATQCLKIINIMLCCKITVYITAKILILAC